MGERRLSLFFLEKKVFSPAKRDLVMIKSLGGKAVNLDVAWRHVVFVLRRFWSPRVTPLVNMNLWAGIALFSCHETGRNYRLTRL